MLIQICFSNDVSFIQFWVFQSEKESFIAGVIENGPLLRNNFLEFRFQLTLFSTTSDFEC